VSSRRTGSASAGSIAQQVGGVVGLHLIQHAGQPVLIEALDEPDLLVLGELLQQVGQPLVLELRGQHPPAAERQSPHRRGHLGRV
jgi:hypothetical protein